MSSNSVKIQVEVDAEDTAKAALLTELMVEVNNLSDYTAEPARDGSIVDIVAQMAQNAWDNRELLKTLFSTALPIITFLTRKKTLKVTVGLESGKTIIVEGEDAQDLDKLVEKYKQEQPEAVKKLTPQSEVKVKASDK